MTKSISTAFSPTCPFYGGSPDAMCCGRLWMQALRSMHHLPKWMHLLPADQYILVGEMSECMTKGTDRWNNEWIRCNILNTHKYRNSIPIETRFVEQAP